MAGVFNHRYLDSKCLQCIGGQCFFAVTTWGEGVYTADKKGSPVVRSELETVQQVVVRRMLLKLKSVMNNPILPLHAMEVTNCSTVSQSECTKVQI